MQSLLALRGRIQTSLAVLLLIVISAGTSLSCNNVPVIGDILDQLSSEIDSVVQSAVATTEAGLLNSADVLLQDVNNEESAFADVLNKTLDQVNADIRNAINRLETDVNDLLQGTEHLLQKATDDGQQLLNSIPFTNKNPQLSSYSPQFITSGTLSTGAPITVHLHGNWPYAIQTNENPKMKVGQSLLSPVELTTFDMAFDVPVSTFRVPSSGAFADTSLEVDVAFERGTLFKSIHPGAFRLLVATLPPSPVTKLTITTTQPTYGQLTTNRQYPPNGGYVRLESYSPCVEDDWTWSVELDKGYQLIPQSLQVVETVLKNSDHVFIDYGADQPTGSTMTVKTKPGYCNAIWTSGCGDVTFYVTYTEQTTVQTGTATKVTDLAPQFGWGRQIVVPVASGATWRIDATMFDGRTLSFVDTGEDSNLPPYLKVVNQGSAVQISAPATTSLEI